jgi:hypothetical protein
MRALVCLVVCLCLSAVVRAESIWVEGEAATETDAQDHNWYNSVKKDVLSGKAWLSHYGDRAGQARYEVDAKEGGAYTLWARLNPIASKPQWKLDTGEWAAVSFKEARGQQNLAIDNKPDHRFIAWVNLGPVDLKTGKHTLHFRWEGARRTAGPSTASCSRTTASCRRGRFARARSRKPNRTSGSRCWPMRTRSRRRA